MGWFKKVFGKSRGKKSSDPLRENGGQADPSDHGNVSEPEVPSLKVENDDRGPETPQENKDEENSNGVAPTSPDQESPPCRSSPAYEQHYQPWSSYDGTGHGHTTSYQQEEDYPREGYTTYHGDHSGLQNWGSFSDPSQHNDPWDRSSGPFTGYENNAGSLGYGNNYWSPPRMMEHDGWNRGQYANSDRDVWDSDYWAGLFKPPQGGWP